MDKCLQEILDAGSFVPYPRVCERCGTGKCIVIGAAAAVDAPEPDPDDPYPWANGDGQILLRSFIFEQLSTPQSTLDFKKEIPSMEAFRTWIMTGTLMSELAPSPSPGSKLKVV